MPATKTKKIRYCPVLDLPPLTRDEYQGLRNTIAVEGILYPIKITVEGNTKWIIDGCYRKQIADDLGHRGRSSVKVFEDV